MGSAISRARAPLRAKCAFGGVRIDARARLDRDTPGFDGWFAPDLMGRRSPHWRPGRSRALRAAHSTASEQGARRCQARKQQISRARSKDRASARAALSALTHATMEPPCVWQRDTNTTPNRINAASASFDALSTHYRTNALRRTILLLIRRERGGHSAHSHRYRPEKCTPGRTYFVLSVADVGAAQKPHERADF